MKLGYACINLTLERTFHTLRLATLQAQGMPYLQQLVNENFSLLAEILQWNREHDILMYRLSSELVPFGSHDSVDLAQIDFPYQQEIAAFATGMRLSTHPGHFTLPSAQGAIWKNSLKDLRYHSDLMERLGIDGDMVLHGGGVYNDRPATSARIVRNLLSLPADIFRHIRLENDERAWSVADLLPICEETGIPLIVDSLHHQILGHEPFAELPWQRILATWHGSRPKLHYSQQDPAKRPGAHSAFIEAPAFIAFSASVAMSDYDVMLECKGKELALLKLREDLATLSTGTYQPGHTAL
ncbi:UV DNA damage repair endonuclease UvsE [Dictyobacter arantiisoli]|uniref:UV DNA damage endonuclease n=1 Tax=Dictyobacter arantiisoli TaxID=2014874 RepID=A0A5A5TGV1_9CHLR|nr:UV DNA damage repair endonuclease UvsE [Dictyobacter arantiisoli]GCF10293.1 UV DNA damage endonuclease [Dictyobacter arantiisoli]